MFGNSWSIFLQVLEYTTEGLYISELALSSSVQIFQIYVLFQRQVELQKIVDKKRAQRAESVKFAKESSEKLDKETRLKIAAMEYSELKGKLLSNFLLL